MNNHMVKQFMFTHLFYMSVCTFFIWLTIGSMNSAQAAEYSQSMDMQVRLDKRSSQSSREQYRIRFYPKVSFNDSYSVHGFVVTGNDFASSNNTFGNASNDYIYLRRLFARYQTNNTRSEFGVIPTYKGKVSSSGLSKDGFIKGARFVHENIANGQLELVIGELNNTSPKNALKSE